MTVGHGHTRRGGTAKGAVLAAVVLLQPMRVEIRNDTGATLECQALAAHWYTLPAVQAAPGASIVMSFGHDPRSGEISADGLAIERLFCGRAGAAWATRAEVDLRRLVGQATIRMTCRAGIVCEEDKARGAAP